MIIINIVIAVVTPRICVNKRKVEKTKFLTAVMRLRIEFIRQVLNIHVP